MWRAALVLAVLLAASFSVVLGALLLASCWLLPAHAANAPVRTEGGLYIGPARCADDLDVLSGILRSYTRI